jgi:hypothetical protein
MFMMRPAPRKSRAPHFAGRYRHGTTDRRGIE